MKNNTLYACISVKDFSIDIFTTKNQVADRVGCHRNSLIELTERTTYGNYIIIPLTVTKCKRGRR